jgi:glutamyl-tRNA synthetase
MPSQEKIRVRIAPSPTGDPHVGTAYVTLFNYVFAKKHGGDLILRIEDTDQSRFKASSERAIMDCLRWLGLKWDEGPDVGGPYGPYRQSERTAHYREYIQILQSRGYAYPCFCSAERLQKLREQQRAEKMQPGYDGHCMGLSKEKIAAKIANGEPHVIRLKSPREGVTHFVDEIRGEITIDNRQIDDQVLMKSDGFPTYHLANVVDDFLMGITHVIRAEEWISSTPKHVILYDAFGWKRPKFAHLPLLRNSDHSKISKRKNPTSLEYYRRKGILPKAMLNFLGLMGWSYSGDQEIFDVQAMMEKFEIRDVHLGGPVFDVVKLQNINQQYISKLDEKEFVQLLQQNVFSDERLRSCFELYRERLESFDQFVDKASFLFNGTLSYQGLEILPKGMEAKLFCDVFNELLEQIDNIDEWNKTSVETVVEAVKTRFQLKPKDYFMPLRLMVTGRKDSPPLIESLVAVGKEMTRVRIRHVLEGISAQ